MELITRVKKFVASSSVISILTDDNELETFKQLCTEVFNSVPNCDGCGGKDIAPYYDKLKQYSINPEKFNQMNQFKLKDNAVLYCNGMHYTNANITDDDVWMILDDSPGNSILVDGLPENWKERIPKEIARIKTPPKKVVEEPVKETAKSEAKETAKPKGK